MNQSINQSIDDLNVKKKKKKLQSTILSSNRASTSLPSDQVLEEKENISQDSTPLSPKVTYSGGNKLCKMK